MADSTSTPTADTSSTATPITVTPAKGGFPCDVLVLNGAVKSGDTTVAKSTPSNNGTTCSVAFIDAKAPPQAVSGFNDGLVSLTLLVLLILATFAGVMIVYGAVVKKGGLDKTMDKLAQLLSEENPPKMSMSRVQAFIFTYVIAFGTLLIIARTGQFPSTIPTELLALAGGSLATYLVSKGIQRNTPAASGQGAGNQGGGVQGGGVQGGGVQGGGH